MCSYNTAKCDGAITIEVACAQVSCTCTNWWSENNNEGDLYAITDDDDDCAKRCDTTAWLGCNKLQLRCSS